MGQDTARNRLSKFVYTADNSYATRESEEVLLTSALKFNSIHSAGFTGFKPSAYRQVMIPSCRFTVALNVVLSLSLPSPLPLLLLSPLPLLFLLPFPVTVTVTVAVTATVTGTVTVTITVTVERQHQQNAALSTVGSLVTLRTRQWYRMKLYLLLPI